MRGAAAAIALAAFALTGCSLAPQSMPFAARSANEAPRAGVQVMSFGDGGVLLAAPAAYCFDRSSSQPEKDGGFALLAHCSRIGRQNWFGASKSAVLTASIGPAKPGAAAPQAADITAMFPDAKVLETSTDQLLPLVKLEFSGAVAEGASPVHWRGAFVLDRHLIALALYAPEGSRTLDSHGAALLNEMTHRTLEASTLPPQDTANRAPAPAPAVSAAAATLRPQLRPVQAQTTNAAPAVQKKRAPRRWIAGLFQ
ncbi:hypothetical protein AB838_18160 [Rhodobacteraceae bacterium (ex Bugula neritina AB1)]|nr:hypothetical protein AB838_18160 [Rhodobacteraceae bacterium (ex Bugula neritina AB1)]